MTLIHVSTSSARRRFLFAFSTKVQTYSTSCNTRISQIINKPKLIPDILSPTNSRLLSISLSDHLPPECLPSNSPDLFDVRSSDHAPSPLPQGHHLVYFPIQARPSQLHPDGTDADHWPGHPFMRRMWAGGEVRFHPGWEAEMALDARPVECVENVEDVRLSSDLEDEHGRVNPKAKAFVDVWRRYRACRSSERDSAPHVIEERRTLVFLPETQDSDDPTASSKPLRAIKSPRKPEYSFSLVPTRALLANFSALTYNVHSIHLDTALTRAEGHRGLLVHGPLSLALIFAALRGRLASQRGGRGQAVRWLGYRNLAPLYCDEEMRVCLREKKGERKDADDQERQWDVWVEGKGGGMAVKGTATTGPLATS